MTDIKHIGELTPDPENARKHNPRNVGTIADGMGQVGAARSIVIDEDGVILAGNATIEAAAQAGIERVQVVDADGETVIAVRRSGLTPEQKKRLALLDNRSAELATWDVEQLLADAEAGFDFDGLFYEDELADLLEDVRPQEPPDDPGAQVDRAAELLDVWQVERGQVWEVPSLTVAGKCHRVMCGDSTSADDVARLMDGEKAEMIITDPPYGVNYSGQTETMFYGNGNAGKSRKKIKSDGAISDVIDLLDSALGLSDGRCLFIWHAPQYHQEVRTAVIDSGWEPFSVIVWNKNHANFGAMGARYKPKFEMALVAKHDAIPWYGPNNEVTVWDVARASVNEYHPTQKPPELFCRAIANHVGRGAIALDLFLGSGTTLVACEQTGRVGYGMEIAPEYCAVTLQRLADMGLEPRLVE